MDDSGTRNDGTGQSSYEGYATPGADRTLDSSNPTIHAPTETSNQRLQPPQARINSINETPGDANPALSETVAEEQGTGTTADMLRARETAEEQVLRNQAAPIYQDQVPDDEPQDWRQTDSGQPNWPDRREEDPIEYMESPRGDMPLLSTNPDVMDPMAAKGRLDWVADRAGTEASKGESRSGLPDVGMNAEEDTYERREMHNPGPPSDLDMIAPDTVNRPPED